MALLFSCQTISTHINYWTEGSLNFVTSSIHQEIRNRRMMRSLFQVYGTSLYTTFKCLPQYWVEWFFLLHTHHEGWKIKCHTLLHLLKNVIGISSLLEKDRCMALSSSHPLQKGSRFKYLNRQGNRHQWLTTQKIRSHPLNYVK